MMTLALSPLKVKTHNTERLLRRIVGFGSSLLSTFDGAAETVRQVIEDFGTKLFDSECRIIKVKQIFIPVLLPSNSTSTRRNKSRLAFTNKHIVWIDRRMVSVMLPLTVRSMSECKN